MDWSWIVPFLALFTLLSVLVYALIGKKAIEERKHDPSVPKSTLAVDGPFGGVGFLRPVSPSARKLDQVEPVLE